MFVARFSHDANVREICDDTPTRDDLISLNYGQAFVRLLK